MSVIVLGSHGQLAQHLRLVLPRADFWGRAEVDFTNSPQLLQRLLSAGPAAIINAAAYTAVDRAESEPALAWQSNAEAPAAMARAAATLDVPLVQVSTDYVFDGVGDRPYRETDPVGPASVYGRTKLGGELAVQSLCKKYWILRTSWVFSPFGSNFVKTILRLARERPELRIVNDQRGCPTYAGDLARLIATLLSNTSAPPAIPWGLHHATGGPAVSWHEFATEICALSRRIGLIERLPEIRGIPTTEYPTPAKRPMNSVLQPSASLGEAAKLSFDWRAGLEQALLAVASAKEL